MEFEPYRTGHEEALIQLHRSVQGGISHGYVQEEEESDLRSIEAAYLNSGGVFLVGFIETRLVAMGGFKIVGDGVAELKRMRIAPELQGRGLGSALLARLEALAREKRLKKLILETAASRPKTLSFYRKQGYAQIGEGRYGAQITFCFEKRLEEAPIQALQ